MHLEQSCAADGLSNWARKCCSDIIGYHGLVICRDEIAAAQAALKTLDAAADAAEKKRQQRQRKEDEQAKSTAAAEQLQAKKQGSKAGDADEAAVSLGGGSSGGGSMSGESDSGADSMGGYELGSDDGGSQSDGGALTNAHEYRCTVEMTSTKFCVLLIGERQAAFLRNCATANFFGSTLEVFGCCNM